MAETVQSSAHIADHQHPDVSGGWLRAGTFGAMDGLVTNTALIAGVGGSGLAPHGVMLSGVAGLVAGAFSMALGEYTSVTTHNEQVQAQVRVERSSFARLPAAEQGELAEMLCGLGMSEQTAVTAAAEIHRDEDRALRAHLIQELGLDPTDQPSPLVAAGSSFILFALGAIIPLLPYLLGRGSLIAGLSCGAIGLALAGIGAAKLTGRSIWLGALRQLAFGAAAVGATYGVGVLVGHAVV